MTDVLENYGICSQTEVSELVQDDFSFLEALGLKPFHVKKLKLWSEVVDQGHETEIQRTQGVIIRVVTIALFSLLWTVTVGT